MIDTYEIPGNQLSPLRDAHSVVDADCTHASIRAGDWFGTLSFFDPELNRRALLTLCEQCWTSQHERSRLKPAGASRRAVRP